MSWVFDLPTGLSFTIFALLIVGASVLGMWMFKQTELSCYRCGEHNAIIGIFVGIISVFLGVVLSFIVVTVWDDYQVAQLNAQKEAQAIYLLYGTIQLLPGTEATQQLIIEYLEYLINQEYPAMKEGEDFPPEGNQLIDRLRRAVYSYNPLTDQQVVLYNESIDWVNDVTTLRIDRFNSAYKGVYPVIWWVAIIDSILIIIMSWFLNCDGPVHYIMVAVAALYVGISLFLILILSYPFQGFSGLTSEPFQIALTRILNPGVTQS